MKKTGMKQYRVYLTPEAIKQVKLFSLVLGREDEWNVVLNECVLAGVAYLNSACNAELAEYDDTLKVVDLKDNLGLRIFRGDLPQLED